MKIRLTGGTMLLAVCCLLAAGCGGKETVAPLPPGYLATLVVNNVAPDTTDMIRKVRVQGPADIGFGPNLLDEAETLAPGEGAVFILPTQDITGAWDVQLTFGYRNAENQRRTGYAQATFRDVIEGLTYTWNWDGYEAEAETETGTIVITVAPDTAPWTLIDSEGTVWQGAGSDILYDIPAGTVVFTWEDLDGYATPDPAQTETELTDDGVIFFLETYAPVESSEGEGEGEK
jgi:hypothetical protein